MEAGRKGLSNGTGCVSINQEPPSLPLTQASLSICSSTPRQPSTIKLPVYFRPNHAERKFLSREAAARAAVQSAGLFIFIFWQIMKSGMHISSPALLSSTLLSKHPSFTLIRLTRLLQEAGGQTFAEGFRYARY